LAKLLVTSLSGTITPALTKFANSAVRVEARTVPPDVACSFTC
jgi:hypothetical protein